MTKVFKLQWNLIGENVWQAGGLASFYVITRVGERYLAEHRTGVGATRAVTGTATSLVEAQDACEQDRNAA